MLQQPTPDGLFAPQPSLLGNGIAPGSGSGFGLTLGNTTDPSLALLSAEGPTPEEWRQTLGLVQARRDEARKVIEDENASVLALANAARDDLSGVSTQIFEETRYSEGTAAFFTRGLKAMITGSHEEGFNDLEVANTQTRKAIDDLQARYERGELDEAQAAAQIRQTLQTYHEDLGLDARQQLAASGEAASEEQIAALENTALGRHLQANQRYMTADKVINGTAAGLVGLGTSALTLNPVAGFGAGLGYLEVANASSESAMRASRDDYKAIYGQDNEALTYGADNLTLLAFDHMTGSEHAQAEGRLKDATINTVFNAGTSALNVTTLGVGQSVTTQVGKQMLAAGDDALIASMPTLARNVLPGFVGNSTAQGVNATGSYLLNSGKIVADEGGLTPAALEQLQAEQASLGVNLATAPVQAVLGAVMPNGVNTKALAGNYVVDLGMNTLNVAATKAATGQGPVDIYDLSLAGANGLVGSLQTSLISAAPARPTGTGTATDPGPRAFASEPVVQPGRPVAAPGNLIAFPGTTPGAPIPTSMPLAVNGTPLPDAIGRPLTLLNAGQTSANIGDAGQTLPDVQASTNPGPGETGQSLPEPNLPEPNLPEPSQSGTGQPSDTAPQETARQETARQETARQDSAAPGSRTRSADTPRFTDETDPALNPALREGITFEQAMAADPERYGQAISQSHISDDPMKPVQDMAEMRRLWIAGEPFRWDPETSQIISGLDALIPNNAERDLYRRVSVAPHQQDVANRVANYVYGPETLGGRSWEVIVRQYGITELPFSSDGVFDVRTDYHGAQGIMEATTDAVLSSMGGESVDSFIYLGDATDKAQRGRSRSGLEYPADVLGTLDHIIQLPHLLSARNDRPIITDSNHDSVYLSFDRNRPDYDNPSRQNLNGFSDRKVQKYYAVGVEPEVVQRKVTAHVEAAQKLIQQGNTALTQQFIDEMRDPTNIIYDPVEARKLEKQHALVVASRGRYVGVTGPSFGIDISRELAELEPFVQRVAGQNKWLDIVDNPDPSKNQLSWAQAEDIFGRLQDKFTAAIDASPTLQAYFRSEWQPHHRSGDFLFTHAGVMPGVRFEDQLEYNFSWARNIHLKTAPHLIHSLDRPIRATVGGHNIHPQPTIHIKVGYLDDLDEQTRSLIDDRHKVGDGKYIDSAQFQIDVGSGATGWAQGLNTRFGPENRVRFTYLDGRDPSNQYRTFDWQDGVRQGLVRLKVWGPDEY